MDLDDGKAGGRGASAPKVSDIVQVYKFPEKKWVTVRLMPGLRVTGSYWVAIKKRDGSKTAFNTACPSFDPESQTRDSTIPDAWRDFEAAFKAANPDAGKQGEAQPPVRFAREWFMDGIVRMEQKRLPETMPKATAAERKTGFKDLDSDTPTPVFGIKLGVSLLQKLQELKALNVVEGKSGTKAFAVNDARWGVDVKILYDSKKAPADQYMVQASEKRTPLTEEELAYLKPNFDEALTIQEIDPKAVATEVKEWAARMGLAKYLAKGKKAAAEDDEDAEEDEDDEDAAPKKKKPVAKKKAAPAEDEDDFDDEDGDDEDDEPAPKKKKKPVEDDEDDFDDEDGDDEPAPKKKPAAKKKAAPVEDDEDDFDDEDDEPAPKKKPAAKKKPAEDDFDDEDGDDEDDEPAPKKKKKPVEDEPAPKKKVVAKKKPAEDDFDDFDDEDDEPAPKKPAAKKKAAPVDEDDEDADDFDDEDDEPAPKKKVVAKKTAIPVAPPKKKKKPVEEDDELDDDDIPF